MFADKTLRCDCGYEVRASDDDVFVEAIRRHAWEAHGIDFSLELALDIARSARDTSNEGGERRLEDSWVIGKERQ